MDLMTNDTSELLIPIDQSPTFVPSTTVHVATHLATMAQYQPHRAAVVYPMSRDRQGRVAYTHYTFRQLHQVSDQLARGLTRIGIERGTRTVLMVTPSLDFFALVFALFKLGAVPVLVDPGMGIRNLGQCLSEAEPTAFIGIPNAHGARVLLGWAKSTLKILVTVGRRLGWGGWTLEQLFDDGPEFSLVDTRADEIAAILFTSGSTGVPKGAVYTHSIFAGQVDCLKQVYGIQPGEIDLPTFPLFALFGPALGMTCIIPDMDPTRPARVQPHKLLEAIDNFGVTNMFGSPAVIDRLGRYNETWRSQTGKNLQLSSLRRVISAGAPVPARVLERFVPMLTPGVQVFTPYGATEALPVSSIGSDTLLDETRVATAQGAGVCVGYPVPMTNVSIIGISDQEIPDWHDNLKVPRGQIGEIVVHGPLVTHSYYRRESSTRMAKIVGANGTIHHRMGDVGYLDTLGRVWFCGRKAHRVETARGTLFTIPCEAIFNQHPEVFRTALVGVSTAQATEAVLCVELEHRTRSWTRADHTRLRRELLALGAANELTRFITTIYFHPAFPVDIRHNAKIFREKLALWATARWRRGAR